MFRKLTVAVCVVFFVVPRPPPGVGRHSWVPTQVGSGEYYSRLLFSDAEHGSAWGGTSIASPSTAAPPGPPVSRATPSAVSMGPAGPRGPSGRPRGKLLPGPPDPAFDRRSSSWVTTTNRRRRAAGVGSSGSTSWTPLTAGWGGVRVRLLGHADGGTTWDAVATPGSVRRMQFVDADDGFACATAPERTGDGGKTWTAIPVRRLLVSAGHGLRGRGGRLRLRVSARSRGDVRRWRHVDVAGGGVDSLIKLAATDALHVSALNGDAVWGSDDAGAHWFLLRPSSGGLTTAPWRSSASAAGSSERTAPRARSGVAWETCGRP